MNLPWHVHAIGIVFWSHVCSHHSSLVKHKVHDFALTNLSPLSVWLPLQTASASRFPVERLLQALGWLTLTAHTLLNCHSNYTAASTPALQLLRQLPTLLLQVSILRQSSQHLCHQLLRQLLKQLPPVISRLPKQLPWVVMRSKSVGISRAWRCTAACCKEGPSLPCLN